MYRLGDVLSGTITAAPPPPSTGGTYELEKLLDSIQVLILWYMTLLHFVAPQLLATPLSLDITSLSARPLLCFTCANYTSSSSSLIEEHEIKLKQLFPKCSSAEICWFCFRPHPFFPAISEAVIKDISYKPCYTKLAHTFSRTV